ncbi:MAG: hypothetical protein EA397_18265 [Deltaproteobacteria bacterium]|nr:MAG: hypothetical protein EA397_18265 [Deltaproteobacteria bacterium]
MLPLFLLVPQLAAASPCDARSLRKELDEATPVAVGSRFQKLAECDERQAKAAAPKAFQRMLAGAEGYAAATRAVELRLDTVVHGWIEGLEPDQRSRAIAALGDQCAESEAVQAFFLATYKDRGDAFFTQRWHRGLTECRVAPIQELLGDALTSKEISRDRPKLFSVLEVYARNLRGDAIPALIDLASKSDDPEELTYLVNAFADTAGVGSVEGLDAAVASKAAEAIVDLAGSLPPRAIEQARTTLTALGATDEADQLAVHRWRERKDGEGNYRYAVAITEQITCKNGKKLTNLHLGKFAEGGIAWPEQLADDLQEKLTYEWKLDGASRCKGSAEFAVEMVEEPFESSDAQAAWVQKREADFAKVQDRSAKRKVYRHEAFVY